MSEKSSNSWKDYEVGGMWENKNKSFYLKIDFKDGNGIQVLKAFKNQFKDEGSKVPDFKIYKDLPENKPQPPKKRRPLESEDIDLDF